MLKKFNFVNENTAFTCFNLKFDKGKIKRVINSGVITRIIVFSFIAE
jgi:hypothetical protein